MERRTDNAAPWFAGGGQLGAILRSKDWSTTVLGPSNSWPQSLRTAVSVMLAAPQPSYVFWGPDLGILYNDGGLPFVGLKHPECLGHSIRDVLKEAWPVLGPLVEGVMRDGTSVFLEDLLIPLDRSGFLQDGYFTFSYIPIRNEAAAVGGILVIVNETTKQVLGGRRLELIREQSLRAARCQTVVAVLRSTEELLAGAAGELPFALLYELRGDRAHLVVCAGVERGHPASPSELRLGLQLGLELEESRVWPLAEAAHASMEPLVTDLGAHLGRLPGGPAGEAAQRAVLLPLASEREGEASHVLIAGLNPRYPWDDDARDFLQLLARQIAASMASTRALEEKTERAAKLTELDRQKTDFFSNVSHEFRTPLTLILGPLEDAMASKHRSLEGASLERVHGNAQRLLKLVNSLLEFSRVEAGKTRARFKPVNLSAVTAALVNAFESVIGQAGLRLVVEFPALPELVWVDPTLWEKIVLNLMSNAFKFTLTGEIAVRLTWTGEGVELVVEDTGTGIPEEELPRIFQRFHRVEGAQGRSHEGSGIGLSLVQELVTLHGGRVVVRSQLRSGSVFTVFLPKGSSHLPAGTVETEATPLTSSSTAAYYVREASHWLPDVPQEPLAGRWSVGTHSISDAATSGPPLRVLVAEDNADMRAYIQDVLAGAFVVETVADGEQALQAARTHAPDVVLSDVMMPRMDGIALTRSLRADPRTAHVPIVLLSARPGEDPTVEALTAGADDYLSKPFGARELVARLQGAVKVARVDAARRRALERTDEVLRSMGDGFFCVDASWRFTDTNPSFERMTEQRAQDVLGKIFWDIFPATRDPTSQYWQQYHRCMETRTPVNFVDHYEPLSLWTDVHAMPAPDGGMAVFFRDVSVDKAAEQDRRRNAEFEQHLIGIVSHDLRNPLNVIQMGASLLMRGEAISDRVLKTADRIQRSATRATHLVNDLLDFTKGRLGGGIPVTPVAMDAHAVIHAVLTEVEVTHPDRDVRFTPVGDGKGTWDPERLGQAVQNLLSNALAYSPADTPIELSSVGDADRLIIVVHNMGAPIPPDRCEHLFEPFHRGDQHADVGHRSVGLGLYIVKQVVEAHGGTIDVTSTAADGTSFTMNLPRHVP